MSGPPWLASIGERVRRNRFTDGWSQREAELRDRGAELAEAAAANRVDGFLSDFGSAARMNSAREVAAAGFTLSYLDPASVATGPGLARRA